MTDIIEKRLFIDTSERHRGLMRDLLSELFLSMGHKEVDRNTSNHSPVPAFLGRRIQKRFGCLDFSHPLYTISACTDVPANDIALLMRIGPGILLETRLDSHSAMKGFGPSLSDLTHDVVMDRFNASFTKNCGHGIRRRL